MQAAEKHRWTAAEYLAFERGSAEKHELHNGELYAMAGGAGSTTASLAT